MNAPRRSPPAKPPRLSPRPPRPALLPATPFAWNAGFSDFLGFEVFVVSQVAPVKGAAHQNRTHYKHRARNRLEKSMSTGAGHSAARMRRDLRFSSSSSSANASFSFIPLLLSTSTIRCSGTASFPVMGVSTFAFRAWTSYSPRAMQLSYDPDTRSQKIQRFRSAPGRRPSSAPCGDIPPNCAARISCIFLTFCASCADRSW